MSSVVFVILIVLIILYSLNKPKIKGVIGEKRVIRQLSNLQPEEYKVLNNIMIKTDKGSTQIDHIVISIFGIFVIETKNYKGWIHGGQNSEYWTQSIYKNKTSFRNPIRQNWAHIYALKKVLSDYGQVPYYPVIVFSGSAKLKNVNTETPVIYDNDLYRTISESRGMPKISKQDINDIWTRLSELNLDGKEAHKEHVQRVRNNASERRQKERSMICPKRGGNLVLRDGKYGSFYGCSNYPKCKYKLSSGAR